MSKEKPSTKPLPSIKVVCLAHSNNSDQPLRRTIRNEQGEAGYSITLNRGVPFALIGEQEIAAFTHHITGGLVNELQIASEQAERILCDLADKSVRDEITRLRGILRELASQLWERGITPAYTIDRDGAIVANEIEEAVS